MYKLLHAWLEIIIMFNVYFSKIMISKAFDDIVIVCCRVEKGYTEVKTWYDKEIALTTSTRSSRWTRSVIFIQNPLADCGVVVTTFVCHGVTDVCSGDTLVSGGTDKLARLARALES